RELAAARRFRARVVAATLAENAAELASEGIVTGARNPPVDVESADGRMTAELRKGSDGTFEIRGDGTSSGLTAQAAWVRVFGSVAGNRVRIDYTIHSQ
ncbi:MAG: hypothetical protein WA208_13535, partial [Thermoanaerobaculia bacterium]